jgi:polysaccharide export outer membrane protein
MTVERLFPRLLLILMLAFATCAGAQDKPSDYRLGPGDGIKITVFQNADLSLETRVSESGAITYPLIGTVQIGGLTLSAAEQVIAGALKKGGFIQQPQVTVNLLAFRGNQVSVLGHVARAGRYPLETSQLRLSDMLATAGGISPDGADFVIVTGIRDGQPFRKEVDIPGMFLDGKRQQDDILVAGGDVIYVQRQPKFYIYGEVKSPAGFRIERNMTIRQALALSGGPTSKSSERHLSVYRRNAGGTIERITPDLNAPVQPDDVLYVRESLF